MNIRISRIENPLFISVRPVSRSPTNDRVVSPFLFRASGIVFSNGFPARRIKSGQLARRRNEIQDAIDDNGVRLNGRSSRGVSRVVGPGNFKLLYVSRIDLLKRRELIGSLVSPVDTPVSTVVEVANRFDV